MEFWITQLFNGISYGALLFLLAGGLSLIFGMMRYGHLSLVPRRGSLRIIAAITHEAVITRLLRPCKLAFVPPPLAPARARQAMCAWVASTQAWRADSR